MLNIMEEKSKRKQRKTIKARDSKRSDSHAKKITIQTTYL